MTTDAVGAPGDRVVVRYARGDGAPGDWRRDPSATRTDVTGVLVSADDASVVVTRDGEDLVVPRSLIVSVRVLPDRAVRTSEIRELETAAARGWPGTDRVELGGWLLRAGGGWSRRANSALPIAFGARADTATMSVIRRWYDDHGLPTTIAVVDRLLPEGAVPDGVPGIQAVVMTRDTRPVGAATAVAVEVSPVATDDWLGVVIGHRDGPFDAAAAADVLRSVVDGTVVFVSVVVDGAIVATGRGAITASSDAAPPWLGISCLWTHPDHRGRAIGTAVVDALVGWARDAGCERSYLQVEQDNADAIRLYRRLGFGRHHGYGYRALR